MANVHLTGKLWAFIEPFVPPPARTGRPRADDRLAEQTLDTIRVARPRGRPKQRPQKLVADRGYDSRVFRRALRGRGIRLCIPPKRRPKNWKAKQGRPVVAREDEYRLRFTVERSFAELSHLPAAADPLGAAVQGLPERIRFRCHAALCAPSGCPGVPDPVGVGRERAA